MNKSPLLVKVDPSILSNQRKILELMISAQVQGFMNQILIMWKTKLLLIKWDRVKEQKWFQKKSSIDLAPEITNLQWSRLAHSIQWEDVANLDKNWCLALDNMTLKII